MAHRVFITLVSITGLVDGIVIYDGIVFSLLEVMGDTWKVHGGYRALVVNILY